MLLRLFGSVRLTIVLLLALALLSTWGTVRPATQRVSTGEEFQEVSRYELYYRNWAFRGVLVLLAANLLVCTLRTLRRNRDDRARFLDQLGGEQLFALPLRHLLPRTAEPERLAEVLAAGGYRVVQRSEERVVAWRGRGGRWGSTLVHVSVLVVMLGALAGGLGFVGTSYLYVGDQLTTYYDWDRDADRPLGFTLRLEKFEQIFYPIDLRLDILDPVTGESLAEIEAREGATVPLPVPGYAVRVDRFDLAGQVLALSVYRNGVYLGDYHVVPGEPRISRGADPGVRIVPVAYRDPVLRQLRSTVTILEEGRVVRQALIEVNTPLSYKGVTIYQTAYGQDRFGLWFSGFQFVNDPGEGLVWLGCIGLMLGLTVAFLLPFRAVGISVRDGERLFVALSGFRGTAGEAEFARLEQRLGEALASAKTD